MTFEMLLETSVEMLEQMSDEQLLAHLDDTLKNHPPIELAIIQKQEALEAQEKLEKKEAKKLEKALLNPPKETKVKAIKEKKKYNPAELLALNSMLEQMKQNMAKMMPKT